MAWFQVSFFSSCLLHTVPVNVVLPDRMGRKPGEKCRTLYLLNGFRGDHTDWLLNTDVVGWSRQYDCAVVMPSGENSAYMDQPLSGSRYGEYVGRELVAFTRKSFPLSDRREDTAVSGLSMGGYGALVTALRYPETFGHAMGLSGGFMGPESITDEASAARFKAMYGEVKDWDTSTGNPEYLAKRLLEAGAPLPELYLACGYNDQLCLRNREYHRFLDALGFPHIYEEGPGSHEWAFWRWALPRALDVIGWKHTGPGFVNPMWVDMRDEQYLAPEWREA